MAGGGKEQVVGYRYSFGQHLLVATNRVAVLALRFQDKLAWQGVRPGGETIAISRPDLFGGEDREGGVVGEIDILDGNAQQQRNGYLQTVLARSTNIPAFRFLSSLVFKRVYIGTNYYPKPPAILLMDNQVWRTWLPQLAQIPRSYGISDAHIVIAVRATPDYVVGGRFDQTKAAVAAYVRSLKGSVNSVSVTDGEKVIARAYNCTDADYEAIAVATEGMVADASIYAQGGIAAECNNFMGFTSSTTGVQYPSNVTNSLIPVLTGGASGGDKILILVSDGFPARNDTEEAKLLALRAAGVNFQWYAVRALDNSLPAYIDNTLRAEGAVTNDDLFNAQTADPAEITNAMLGQLFKWVDINPIHILYDVITGTLNHTNVNTDLIGDSFAAAAQVLFDEDFGVSFLYRTDEKLKSFIETIERHIDGRVYFDRNTGKYEINLVRQDYDVNTLFTFDKTNVTTWKDDISDELQSGLVNRMVLVYRSQVDGKKKAITVQDLTSIQEDGGHIVSEKVEYAGVYDDALANKLANRDFTARNLPKWSGNFTASYAPANLNRGSAFILNNPDLGINNVVCRVVSIGRPTPTQRSVNIEFIQDQFDLDGTVDTEVVAPPDTTKRAQPATARVVEEAPHYFLARRLGDVELASRLSNDNTIGYLQTSWAQPATFHLEASTFINDGSGWDSRGTAFPAPSKALVSALTSLASDNVLEIPSVTGIETVRVGSLLWANGEYMRVDSVDNSVNPVELTVGRGCLDTPPKAHPAGTELIFCGDLLNGQDVEYTDGEQIDVRMVTRTGSDRLPLNSAPNDQITFDQRAYRPYPAGNLRLNGQYGGYNDLPANPLSLTWAHRDRTMQTSAVPQDYAANDIGPEAGVSYTASVLAVDDAGTILATIETTAAISGNTYAVTTTDIAAIRPPTATQYAFRVTSVRGGLTDFISSEIKVPAFAAPLAFAGVRRPTLDIDLTWTDINSGSIQEDSYNLYRSTATFDKNSLPPVLTSLPADTVSYTDPAVADVNQYYMLEVVKAGLPSRFTNVLTVGPTALTLQTEDGADLLTEAGDKIELE